MPPVDLRHVAPGARIFRRVHRRPDGHAVIAHDGVFREEPRRAIPLRALGGGWRQRPLRDLPRPHRYRRTRRRDPERPGSGSASTSKARSMRACSNAMRRRSSRARGNIFTPRALIDAMVTVVDPEPRETVHDPACGTGGFLLAAWEHMRKQPLARNAEIYTAMWSRFSGIDIVPEVVRLCAMNLYLHDIAGRESPIEARDALLGDGGKTYDLVLTNPPFGKKQSYRIVRDDGEIDTEREDYDRQDFFVTTSNKQLNFLQHVMTVLTENGRAAVVMPDNVLFEGGAGETTRRRLLHNFDFHTLLRLPTGIFYKQGVKANVLFFDKKRVSAEPNTKELWIYDLRTNQRFTLKERPMVWADLDDFVACHKSGRRHERAETDRFHRFSHAARRSRQGQSRHFLAQGRYARRPRPAAAARRDCRRNRREPGSGTRPLPQS